MITDESIYSITSKITTTHFIKWDLDNFSIFRVDY